MLFILVLTTIFAVLIVRQHLKARRLPPGPYSFPLIGNLPQFAFHVWREKGVVPAFNQFRKKYGDIFTLWLGPVPHVNIADYETSHKVFVKEGNNYKDRSLIPIVAEYSQGHGFFGSNGEMWAEIRRFTLLTLRNMGVGRDLMQEKIMREMDARCAEIDARAVNGTTVVLSASFFDLIVGSIINNLLVGKRFDDSNVDEFMHLRKLMLQQEEAFNFVNITVPAWFLKKFLPSRYDAFVGTQRRIGEFVMRDVTERLEAIKAGTYSIDPENPTDILDAFLDKMQEEDHHPAYNIHSLQTLFGDLWGAGQETTSMTLVNGFNQLVNHPEVIEKVRAELLVVTENRSRELELTDRATTHYFNATIAEIQRHSSVLNISFWKVAGEPTTVKGYPIEKGTLIAAQLSSYHTNEEIYRNPQEFRPERFIENDKLIAQLIPFGIGKRSCVGENLARAELYLIFGNLLLRYDVKPHAKYPKIVDQLPYGAGRLPDIKAELEFRRI